MILKNTSIDTFIESIIKNEKELILFGSGVLANNFIRYLIKNFKDIKIKYLIDNDINKQGKKIQIYDYDINIKNPKVLSNVKNKNIIILVTSSYYYEIIKQLDLYDNLKNNECYVLPIIYTANLRKNSKGIINKSTNSLIPKKIHYMWFGNNEMPEKLKKCVESWKYYCRDYEIIRWDESNYDITKCEYTKQAYENRAWGFITDYARLDILYNHGGIYIDTDVEIIKNIDDMLYQEAFTSIEKWSVINSGGCTGAVKHNRAIKKMLDSRKNIKFINEDNSLNKMASGYYDTIPFIDEGYILNGEKQSIGGLNIYSYDYFHPYDYMTGKLEVTENTLGIHHFNGGWIDDKGKSQREITQRKYDEILKRMDGK